MPGCLDGLGGHSRNAFKMKKIAIGIVILFVCGFAAHAALPLLAVPIVEAAVTRIAITQAGKQIIKSIGTAAANNAEFAALVNTLRGTQVAAWLGLGAVTAAWPIGDDDYPVADQLGEFKYMVQVGPLSGDSYRAQFKSPGYRINYTNYYPYQSLDYYGSTREKAINKFLLNIAKDSEQFVKSYGHPSGNWYVADYQVEGWNDTRQMYWTFTFKSDGKLGEYSYDVIPADPVESLDGTRRIIYDSYNGFRADPDDPDWDKQSVADFAQRSGVSFRAKNDANQPLRVAVLKGDSVVTITEDIEQTDPKPAVLRNSISINPLSGSAVSSEGKTVSDADLVSYPLPDTSSSNGNSGNSSGWPSDYARDPTVQKVVDGQEKLFKELSDAKEVEIPEGPDSQSLKDTMLFKGVFDRVLGFELPPHRSECPVIEFSPTLSGSQIDIVIDGHCQLLQQGVADTLNIAFGIFYLVCGFIILMKA